MTDLSLLTDDEHSMLIRASSRERYLLCSFGVGWISLRDIPENAWAYKLVNEYRAGRLVQVDPKTKEGA